jgi:4-amino-4-deoxychorismate lyase
MGFIRKKGIPGLIYVPDQHSQKTNKNNCKDCFCCRYCSDEKCDGCMRNKAGKSHAMIELVESIKIDNGQIPHLYYHNQRFNQTRKELFQLNTPIDLGQTIVIPDKFKTGTVKCRVIYNRDIKDVQFAFYKKRDVKKLKLVYCDGIDYTYKYTDKTKFKELKKANSQFDDILIIKNGYITDTSYSNIAFFDGSKWKTPTNPLLKGTTRQRLLDNQIIEEALIKPEDLMSFQKAILFNAMIDFEEGVIISMDQI